MSKAATRAVLWSGTEAAVAGGLSFASAFVVARLVGPSEFGIGAAAVALHVMLWVGVNALFADALVQRPALDEATIASAFWASIGVGTLAALVQAGAGPLIAAGLGDRRLLAMAGLLALPLPLVGAAGVAQGLLTRRRAYRALAGRAIVGQGIGTAAGVLAALHHAGAWAPVLQQMLSSTAGAATLLAGAGWRPRLLWQPASIRALLRVALPLTASTLVLTARYRLFALLVGATAGPTALGQTHMAFRLVDSVRELCSTALWRLMLPVLAERQDDITALQSTTRRLLWQSAAAMLPLCGALALVLPAVVHRLLGPAWSPTARAAEPLVALMALLAVMFPAGVALVARGQTGRALAGHVLCLVLTLAAVAWLRPVSAGQAVLLWCAGQLFAAPYALWVNGRAVGSGPLRPLREAGPAAAATIAGLAAAIGMAAWLGPGATVLAMGARLAAFAGVTTAGLLVLGRPSPVRQQLAPSAGARPPSAD